MTVDRVVMALGVVFDVLWTKQWVSLGCAAIYAVSKWSDSTLLHAVSHIVVTWAHMQALQ